MMRSRFFKVGAVLALIAMTILIGCKKTSVEDASKTSFNKESIENPKGKGRVYYDLFDTVSYIYSYNGDSDEEFVSNCDYAYSILQKYHMLFDIYNEYSGINNLASLNKSAGGDWLEFDPLLIEFLKYSKDMCELTKGEMNVMMGSVLNLWHIARYSDTPYVPEREDLEEAFKYSGFEYLEIDEVNNRARITDSRASIDVGALGKGYATEMAAKALEEKGITSYVLNIGGNIRIIGTKVNGDGWVTGIRDPKNPDENFAIRIDVKDTAVVTSGSYERYFTVDGVKYTHIIDKDTLEPARFYDSLTVVTKDSGLADCLSTALYCMPIEDGLELVNNLEGVEAFWILSDGSERMSNDFKNFVV